MSIDDIQRFLRQTDGASFHHSSANNALYRVQSYWKLKDLRTSLPPDCDCFAWAYQNFFAQLLKSGNFLTIKGQDSIADFNAGCFPGAETGALTKLAVVHFIRSTRHLINYATHTRIGVCPRRARDRKSTRLNS